MMTLSRPLVSLFLERGEFSSGDSQSVAVAVIFYFGVLVSGLISTPISKVLYSLKAVRFLAVLSILNTVLTFGLSYLFMKRLGFMGIALGVSLAKTWPLQLFYLRRRIGPLGLCRIARSLVLIVFSSVLMGGVILVMVRFFNVFFPEPNKVHVLIQTSLLVFVGGGVYLISTFILNVEELAIIRGRFRQAWLSH